MESRRGPGGGGQALAPGPGAYDTVEYEAAEQPREDPRRRLRQMPKPSLSKSHSDSFVQEPKEVQSSPPPGAYNPVHIRDTGTVMRLPPRGEGFLSGGARLQKQE